MAGRAFIHPGAEVTSAEFEPEPLGNEKWDFLAASRGRAGELRWWESPGVPKPALDPQWHPNSQIHEFGVSWIC